MSGYLTGLMIIKPDVQTIFSEFDYYRVPHTFAHVP